MAKKLMALIAMVGLALLMQQSAPAQTAPRPAAAPAAAIKADAGAQVDPKVIEIMKQLSDAMQSVEHVRVKTYDVIEEVGKDGIKLQLQQVRTVVLSRPDKLKVDSRGDISNKTIYLDGNIITLQDHDENVYSQKPYTGKVEDAMDNVLIPYGLSVPMAEFLSSQPYVTLMKKAKSAKYLGEHLVGEIKCHHLLVQQENLYWQLWVDTSMPFIHKVVITYPDKPGQPTYTVNYASAEKLDSAPLEEFAFTAKPDAIKIQFMPLDTRPK